MLLRCQLELPQQLSWSPSTGDVTVHRRSCKTQPFPPEKCLTLRVRLTTEYTQPCLLHPPLFESSDDFHCMDYNKMPITTAKHLKTWILTSAPALQQYQSILQNEQTNTRSQRGQHKICNKMKCVQFLGYCLLNSCER